MNRALSASVAFHFVTLCLLLLFGARVDQTLMLPHRQISVKLVEFPKPTAPEPVIEETKPEEKPLVETKPEVTPPVETKPTPVPETVPVETKPVEKDPEPVVVEPEPELKSETPPAETKAETPAPPSEDVETQSPEATLEIPADTPEEFVHEETAIAGTDQVVPSEFQYYLTLLEGRVSRQWNPKMLGFREGSTRVCIVHFYIEKDGMIVRESVIKSSGVPLFDREALKAIKAVGRFLALPPGLDSGALGVTYVFTLKTRD